MVTNEELQQLVEGFNEHAPDNWYGKKDKTIHYLARRVLAAEKLVERFELALYELDQWSVEFEGESYNCPDHNEALAEYRDASK